MSITVNNSNPGRVDAGLAAHSAASSGSPRANLPANNLGEIDLTEPRQQKTALRVLETLNRWDERLNGSFQAERKHSRSEFCKLITIVIPAVAIGGEPGDAPVPLKAWCRNLSQGGLSFVFPQRLAAETIIVGIGTDESPKWFHAEIVRTRQVIESYWEHGVAFRSRAKL